MRAKKELSFSSSKGVISSREKRELEAKGITPTPQLRAKNMGVDESEIIQVEQGLAGSDISLDAPIGNGESELRYEDTLQLMEQGVDEMIAQGEFRSLLEQKFEEGRKKAAEDKTPLRNPFDLE